MTRVLLSGLLLVALNAPAQEPKLPDSQAEVATLRAEGLELFEQGKDKQAMLKLGEARAKGAKDPEVRSALGQIYLKREMFQKALIEFSEVLKDNPNQLQANLGRAESLIGLGDPRKAVGPVKLVTEIEPENTLAWEVLGNAYAHEQYQDFEKAQAAYKKALELNPKSKTAAMNLARALNFGKEVEQAIVVMESMHKQYPDDVAVAIKLAESYYAIRKLDRAEELIGQALEVDPGNKAALHVQDQIKSRQAYNFWVPIIAIIAFPILFLIIRWMRKGRLPKVKDA